MTPFVSFLLKANLVLILLYGFYFLCFRRDTFYGHIRWYLLLSIVSVIIFPLIDISNLLTGSPVAMGVSQNIPDVDLLFRYVLDRPPIEPAVEPGAVRPIPWGLVFRGCWLSIFVFLLGKRLFQFVCIIRLGCRYPRKHQENCFIINVEKNLQPFSFVNCIFLNTSLYTNDELDRIIAHEQVHCRQGHTMDILLAEILVCLFWFNPVAWLLRRDLKQNIEYYTDRMTLRSGFDRKHYQYSLLHVSDSGYQIVNHFYFNNLKKRIIMMNKKETPRMMSAKYLLVIPALAAAFLTVQISGLQAGETLGTEDSMVTVTAQNPDSVKQETNPIHVLQVRTLKKPSKPPVIVLNEEIISNEEMYKIDPATIGSVTVLKGDMYGDKAADGIIHITLKTTMEAATDSTPSQSSVAPIRIEGKDVVVIGAERIPFPIRKRLDTKNNFEKVITSLTVPSEQSEENAPILFIVDEKEISNRENISLERIQSITILKDQSAIEMYGDKGKNGVVVITTKK